MQPRTCLSAGSGSCLIWVLKQCWVMGLMHRPLPSSPFPPLLPLTPTERNLQTPHQMVNGCASCLPVLIECILKLIILDQSYKMCLGARSSAFMRCFLQQICGSHYNPSKQQGAHGATVRHKVLSGYYSYHPTWASCILGCNPHRLTCHTCDSPHMAILAVHQS